MAGFADHDIVICSPVHTAWAYNGTLKDTHATACRLTEPANYPFSSSTRRFCVKGRCR
jgi:hypothetical protein